MAELRIAPRTEPDVINLLAMGRQSNSPEPFIQTSAFPGV